MASATSFYDFKPLDSKCPIFRRIAPLLRSFSTGTDRQVANRHPPHRARTRSPPERLQGQSRPHRQHSLQVRFYPAVRRPRDLVQVRQGQVPGGFRHFGLPLQPVRLARTRHRRRDPEFLPGQLRRFIPDYAKD